MPIMRKIFYFFTLSFLLLALSCGGGGSSSSGGSGSQSPGSGWPSGDYNYLNQHNASFNNGIIIRWQTPILVNTNGISGAEDSMRQWGLPFTFVNYNPAEGIILISATLVQVIVGLLIPNGIAQMAGWFPQT